MTRRKHVRWRKRWNRVKRELRMFDRMTWAEAFALICDTWLDRACMSDANIAFALESGRYRMHPQVRAARRHA